MPKMSRRFKIFLNQALDMKDGTLFVRYIQGEALSESDELKALRFKKAHWEELTQQEEIRYWHIQETHGYEI